MKIAQAKGERKGRSKEVKLDNLKQQQGVLNSSLERSVKKEDRERGGQSSSSALALAVNKASINVKKRNICVGAQSLLEVPALVLVPAASLRSLRGHMVDALEQHVTVQSTCAKPVSTWSTPAVIQTSTYLSSVGFSLKVVPPPSIQGILPAK